MLSPYGSFEGLLEPDAPTVWDTWGLRRLSREDAKALQRELASVFKRYPPSEQAEGAEACIVRLAMAPREES